jgi:cytoskeletal protein RodZ
LTTLFSDTAISTASPIDAPLPRKKRGWLPLLTILFCISYGLMTMLIVEQGSTIESQRALILELFRDSSELTATKMKALSDKRAAASSAKAQNQTPSTQDPSTQDHSSQTPSSQAAPQHGRQNPAQKAKPQFQMPSRPASDLADDRRALITI